MIESGFVNGDCMDYLKEYPDNYFDLAICDPPYGDGGGGASQAEQGLVSASTGTSMTRINRGGWHGKQKYHLGQTLRFRNPEVQEELREPAELGRPNTQKNHNVGCGAGKIILQ